MRTALHRVRIQGDMQLRRLYRDRGTPFPRGMPRSQMLPGERLPALRPMPGHPLRHADRLFLRPGTRRYAPWSPNRAMPSLAQRGQCLTPYRTKASGSRTHCPKPGLSSAAYHQMPKPDIGAQEQQKTAPTPETNERKNRNGRKNPLCAWSASVSSEKRTKPST